MMVKKVSPIRWIIALVSTGLFFTSLQSNAVVLDGNCVISTLNRTIQVNPNGGWSMPNVPSSMGQIRARATCIVNGQTVSGQSDYFTVARNGITRVGEIVFADIEPIPSSLIFDPSTPEALNAIDETLQLKVLAAYADSSTKDVTNSSNGTNYLSTNPAIVTVRENGLLTARASGSVLVTARKDGVLAVKRITVNANGDSDSDGLPDDYEQDNGLNPNDPIDALEDQDKDGLSALEEFNFGTDLNDDDSDGDSINDGEEVVDGEDGFITNPLLADTDGDGLADSVEITVGSSPIDETDTNFAAAVTGLSVNPDNVVMTFNTINSEVSTQLMVTGELIDGSTIDLTSKSTETSYSSSDITVVSFGITDGEIFGGQVGAATVTVQFMTLSFDVNVVVDVFQPSALSFISIPGFANDVDISGNYAFVAAGVSGLQVVDVSDRENPVIVGVQETPGNANDVKINGNYALVADGASGLQVIDITDPTLSCGGSCIVGFVDTPGTAQDIVLAGTHAYLADGESGLQIIDVSSMNAPAIIGSVDPAGVAKGVAVNSNQTFVATADGTAGIHLIDISDPTQPTLLGGIDTGDARDVAFNDDFLLVGDYNNSLRSVDISDPSAPVIKDTVAKENGGLLLEIEVANGFVFGADVFFVNGVPIVDPFAVDNLLPQRILDFSGYRDDNGTGVAVDANFVYLTAGRGIVENGSSGDTRLYIGQYLSRKDLEGIPPVVTLTSPADGDVVIEGASLSIAAQASDDIAVAAVDLIVDGELAFSDSTAPYGFNYNVPLGVKSLSISADAVDLGGNLGQTNAVSVVVIADPLTGAIGVVQDREGQVIENASVQCLDKNTVSGNDGGFSITFLPTAAGAIRCSATFVTPGGTTLTGSSPAVPAVAGGITDVGAIILDVLTYFGYSPVNNATLKVVAWDDNTDYQVKRLDNGAVIASGTLNKYGVYTVNIGSTRHFKMETSTPVLATFGYDCCNSGGSFFYPAIDGRKRVGREYIVRIPVLSSANEIVVFAHEAAELTIRNIAGNIVLTRTLAKYGTGSTTGSPLAANTVYHVTSTGDISIQSNSRNGNSSAPARDGTDVGTEFLCGVHQWSTSAVAAFAYDDTQVIGTNLGTGAQLFGPTTILAGNYAYFSGLGVNTKIKVESTGRIGLWCGSTEGANDIAYMGDDLTMNTGVGGFDYVLHSQSQRAVLFALQNNTTVNINGTLSLLNADALINLPGNTILNISADKPVILETVGGNTLNDWETVLRLIP